jgi:hypothetical protein
MNKLKVDIKELERAIAYLKKRHDPSCLELEITLEGRLLVKSTNFEADLLVVTLYEESTNKMAEVTSTERLPKE